MIGTNLTNRKISVKKKPIVPVNIERSKIVGLYIAHDDGNNDGKVVFVWDRTTRTTTRIVNRLNSLFPLVSSNGAHVAYSSGDRDMINGPHDVYLWDRLN